MEFGPKYIIPSPFDPRLISIVSPAVAKAAMDTGVARRKIEDWDLYKAQLSARLNPAANVLRIAHDKLRDNPKTVVFAEGEEEKIIRAALQWNDNGFGNAILVGDEDKIKTRLSRLKSSDSVDGIKIISAEGDNANKFASSLVNNGDGDIVVTGLTKNYHDCLVDFMQEIGPKKGERVMGVTIAVDKHNETIFISDTAVHIEPDAKQLARITKGTCELAEKMGETPRAALLSFSNFGNPDHPKRQTILDAIKILDDEKVSFEYDGDVTPDVALEKELLNLYPQAKLKESANCLIMPSLEASNISGKMIHQVGGSTIIGPVLLGFNKPAQIIPIGSSVSEILNIASVASV
jgi:malate dehydrogenase (oxaloacetate-decarboxylating)(NADP+)